MPIYSDLNKDFLSQKELSVDIQDIYNSIWNIITTNKGERLFLPEFGASLEDLLFEPMSHDTAFIIWNAIIDAINRWDNRIILDNGNSRVDPDYDNNVYNLYLVFRVVGLGEQQFEFYAQLGRE